MNFEKYIGIPYVEKGRDISGVDCWGLVRLIYKEQYNIDLPSFSSEYEISDDSRIAELFAQYKEGWEKLDTPQAGDVVIFRMFGYESHIGLIISNTHFIHVREGRDTVIESLENAKWSKRISGFFKYSEKGNVVLNGIPHPLKTERYTSVITPGTTVSELVEKISSEHSVSLELKSRINILVNGIVIPQEMWSSTVIKYADVVEYRAVAGKDVIKTLAILAIAYYAPVLAGSLTGYTSAAAAAATMGTTVTVGLTALNIAATAAIYMAGSALVNAIAPIRPPVSGSQNDPGSAERQLMVNGGANRPNPYGAIPVVLGKVRMTPVLGSNNFLTYENERDSYVSMLLVWGYGPLQIDDNSYKIGETPLSNFTDVTKITLDRKTEPNSQTKAAFDAIYGKDTTQVNTAIELTCDGNPETSVSPGPWFEAVTTETTNTVTVSFHFPQGLRYIRTKGDGAGDSFATSVNLRIQYSVNDGVSWSDLDAFSIGGDVPKKDAFTFNKTYELGVVPKVMVRVRRENGDNTEDNSSRKYYFAVNLQTVTFLRNSSPALDPVDSKIAKTAFKIKATDQLNGNIEGINAIVQTWCLTWNGTAWVYGTTSNPAALMRYVLEHPANPKRITNAASQINLTQLQYFHEFCAAKGFEYNSILGEQRSILDVIRDICAAGRASPALIDGKWTVVIDEAKPNVVQHFTPHNSTGFEGSKGLPKHPDGLRITYYDQDANYQESEIIVYNTGKNATNASLFESITLPGITKKSLVIDHAKWHMAQIKLRPEIYTLNLDVEYLVCNRGDRVKVMHDVPMWGLGSGRIKNRISSTVFELDETIPYKVGSNYVVRFRGDDGSTNLRTITPSVVITGYSRTNGLTKIDISTGQHPFSKSNSLKLIVTGAFNININISPTSIDNNAVYYLENGPDIAQTTVGGSLSWNDGFYSRIRTTSSLTTAQANNNCLFLYGENTNESQDLIVLSIEPSNNKTARLTMVDYGVTNTYDIFTQYQSLTESLVFESQVSNTPVLQLNGYFNKTPTITGFVSDESVMERVSKTVFKYAIHVGYVNAPQLPVITDTVELQYDFSESTTDVNAKSVFVPYQRGAVVITDVDQGETYKMRVRYVGRNGKLSNWSSYVNHTVVGKINPPSSVTEFSVTSDKSSGQLLLSWKENPESDTFTYEVRTQDANWGSNNSNLIFHGDSTKVLTPYNGGSSLTFYIRAVDTSLNYSQVSSIVSYVPAPVPNITDIVYSYADTALTSATVTLSWSEITNSEFNIASYEVSYNGKLSTVKGNTINLPADWIGDRTFTVKAVDIHNKKSTGYSELVSKLSPNAPSDLRTQVVDNTVMLYWTLPARTSLPIDHVLLKKGEYWETAVNIGEKKGEFTTITELQGGQFTYWLSCVDTEGVSGVPVSVTTVVSQPPDYVFNAEVNSAFTGTKSNAAFDGTTLVLPVNNTETWQSHFTSRGWTTPQNQIAAGYPIYAQPSATSGYYEEVFDFTQPLVSSRITLSYKGNVVIGSPVVSSVISTSLDNITYDDYVGVSELFGTNFRYVKIKIIVSDVTSTSLYAIENITVRLDAKLKNDAGYISALSTDSLGSIVNFNNEFIDVKSITLSASGTTPITCVYDMKDDFVSGTYSVSSNVCTVNINNHGLITGQKVKLFISSGTGIPERYTITSYTTNSFTVNMITANTSGNASMYPQSFRAYLFNNSGTRVSADVSWSIKGY